MCPWYDKLSDLHKGIVQIAIGATTVLYIFAILPFWIPLLASLALIAHGCFHAGFFASIERMLKKNNLPK